MFSKLSLTCGCLLLWHVHVPESDTNWSYVKQLRVIDAQTDSQQRKSLWRVKQTFIGACKVFFLVLLVENVLQISHLQNIPACYSYKVTKVLPLLIIEYALLALLDVCICFMVSKKVKVSCTWGLPLTFHRESLKWFKSRFNLKAMMVRFSSHVKLKASSRILFDSCSCVLYVHHQMAHKHLAYSLDRNCEHKVRVNL